MVQSRDAFVYHLTCRGHRWNKGVGIVNGDYESTMSRCRRDFIRKWGDWIQNDSFQFPIINSKYDIGFIIKNSSMQLLEVLEPWCSTVYIDDVNGNQYKQYIEKEQSNTIIDLSEKIKPYDNEKNNEILVTIDGNTFLQQDFKIINQLSAIITDNGEIGKFALGNLEVEIFQMKDYVSELVYL